MFESWIAIRYLGRILECSSFWTHPSLPNDNHRFVTEKVLKRVTQLVEDLDLEHPSVMASDVSSMILRVDIDAIASALLEGAKKWDGTVQFQPDGLGLLLERLVGLLCQ
jgi:hypothetical protein